VRTFNLMILPHLDNAYYFRISSSQAMLSNNLVKDFVTGKRGRPRIVIDPDWLREAVKSSKGYTVTSDGSGRVGSGSGRLRVGQNMDPNPHRLL
jgi:hypothetical protein